MINPLYSMQLIDFDRIYNAVTLNGKTTQKQT